MEMGAQNHQKKNQNLNTNPQPVNIFNNFQRRNRNANYQQSREDLTHYTTVPQNYQFTTIFTNCGQR